MSTDDSSKATRDTVARLAEKSFADHTLAWYEETRIWSCRAPGSSAYWFCLFFAPGVAVMWGDLGEFVWRHSDRDSLAWFVGQGGEEGDYPDYFLGKLQACRESAKVFFADDAVRYVLDAMKDDSSRFWADLLERFQDARVSADESLEAAWHRAWSDVIGDEAPSCRGWSASALWAWYVARTFARLHGPYIEAQAQERRV